MDENVIKSTQKIWPVQPIAGKGPLSARGFAGHDDSRAGQNGTGFVTGLKRRG
jgi:hypothetical protein